MAKHKSPRLRNDLAPLYKLKGHQIFGQGHNVKALGKSSPQNMCLREQVGKNNNIFESPPPTRCQWRRRSAPSGSSCKEVKTKGSDDREVDTSYPVLHFIPGAKKRGSCIPSKQVRFYQHPHVPTSRGGC